MRPGCHWQRVSQLATSQLGRVILAFWRLALYLSSNILEHTYQPREVNGFSPVASHDALRAMVPRPNRNAEHPLGPRRLATVDNKNAYLQGDDLPEDHPPMYLKVKDPRGGRWIVIKCRCYLYGSDKAAKWWYESQRKQLSAQGFVQGFAPGSTAMSLSGEYQYAPSANCPCLFHHPETGMDVLCYGVFPYFLMYNGTCNGAVHYLDALRLSECARAATRAPFQYGRKGWLRPCR